MSTSELADKLCPLTDELIAHYKETEAHHVALIGKLEEALGKAVAEAQVLRDEIASLRGVQRCLDTQVEAIIQSSESPEEPGAPR